MKKSAIIFDHDGTLVDSIDAVVYSTNHVLKQYGFEAIPKKTVLEGFPYATPERFLYHTGINDRTAGDEMAASFYENMNEEGIEHLKIYPGIKEALDKLADYGYSMGMVTNNQGLFVRKAAAYLHYAYALEIILGDENVKAVKPSPSGILQACAGLAALPENCWYVGDTTGDCRAGRAGGLKCAAVCWGVQSEEQLAGAMPDALFKSPAEMADYFISREL